MEQMFSTVTLRTWESGRGGEWSVMRLWLSKLGDPTVHKTCGIRVFSDIIIVILNSRLLLLSGGLLVTPYLNKRS
jgi:hypothetical protein